MISRAVRMILAAVVLLPAAIPLAGLMAAGALAEDYRLLSFGGVTVKWGAPQFGMPARVTWALQANGRHDPDAINCKTTRGLEGLLRHSMLDEDVFRAQAEAAFAMWERAAGIDFEPAVEGEHADIVIGAQAVPRGIAWTDIRLEGELQPRDLRGRSVATPDTVRTLEFAAICLNPGRTWKTDIDGNTQTFDLRRVLAHEIGHTIGLDHSGRAGHIMGFSYQEDLSALTQGDIAGAVSLYGMPTVQRPGELAPVE